LNYGDTSRGQAWFRRAARASPKRPSKPGFRL